MFKQFNDVSFNFSTSRNTSFWAYEAIILSYLAFTLKYIINRPLYKNYFEPCNSFKKRVSLFFH